MAQFAFNATGISDFNAVRLVVASPATACSASESLARLRTSIRMIPSLRAYVRARPQSIKTAN